MAGIRASLLVFLLFVAAALAALWAASGEDIWSRLTMLGFVQIALLLALSLANYLLRALRWQLCLRTLGVRLGLWAVLRHYFGGFALTMTPARMGELVRLRWIARESGERVERLAPLVLVDRAGDLASTALVLALALAAGVQGIAGGLPVVLMALGAALLATRPRLFVWLTDSAWRLVGRWPRLFVRARRAARALAPFSAPRVMGPVLALGALGWIAEGYAFYLLLDWMGAPVPLWTAVAIFLFSMVTGGATGMPGGLGGAEAAMVALLAIQGVPLAVSIPATAIIRITTLWFAIGLGMLVFPLAEGMAARTKHALENG